MPLCVGIPDGTDRLTDALPASSAQYRSTVSAHAVIADLRWDVARCKLIDIEPVRATGEVWSRVHSSQREMRAQYSGSKSGQIEKERPIPSPQFSRYPAARPVDRLAGP
jgi:hypothetical protein